MFLYEKGHYITTMKNKIILILLCLLLLFSFSYAGIWASLGRKADVLFSLAVFDGNLFTGDDAGILGTYKNGVWSSKGSIAEGTSLRALAVYDGNLFAGYDNGILGTYNNEIFTSLGDIGGGITSFEFYDGNLFYVSGNFVGTYNNDSKIATDLGIYAYSGFFTIYNGNIFADHPDDGCAKYIDGVGSIGTNCYSLAVFDGNLFIGDYDGSFLTYGDIADPIHLADISASNITALIVYDGNLFTGDAVGVFGTYNNESKIWTNLGDIGGAINSLAVYDGNLFTGQSDGVLGTYKTEAPPEPEPPAQPSPATINIDPLFQSITGLFSIFSGIIMGVSHQSTNIGQFFGIGLLLSAVVVAFGALFVVMKNGVGGFGKIFGGKV
jgi:hypothetical protein